MAEIMDHAAWVAAAEADAATARQLLDSDFSGNAAILFHAQQAVEKLLKACLLRRGCEFPERTSDLGYLINELSKCDYQLAEDLRPAAALTIHAQNLTNPEDVPDATAADARAGVELMNNAIALITLKMKQP